MKTVLVTAIGSFSADIVIKKLKEADYRVVGCDINRKELIVDAYNVDAFYQAPLATAEHAFMAFLQDICIFEKVDYVFPLTDVEVDFLNSHRDWFDDNNIRICISPKSAIDICRDKKRFAEAVRKSGIVNTIPTFTKEERETHQFHFPVVCKPINGRSSIGLRYVYDYAELELVLNSEQTSEYIIQPYIKGNIVTVDVVADKYGKAVATAREELLRTKNGAGTSVYVFKDAPLEESCEELAVYLGIIGCVNFEFIKADDGKYYILECNPRFSGGVEFSCIAGFNYVINHLKCFENEHLDENPAFKNMYIARKYEEYVTQVEEC